MKKNYLRQFIVICIFLIILVVIYTFILNCVITNTTHRGTFGDSFGALNTLFSGLALGGIIISIMMQQNEMQDQRIEMEMQREEMKLQRLEMSSSRYQNNHDRITNLVYLQLSKFEKSVENLKLTNFADEPTGNNAIYYLEKNLRSIDKDGVNKDEQKKEAIAQKIDIHHNFFILGSVHNELSTFIISSQNSISAVKSILKNNDLTEKDNQELKDLFVCNIGYSLSIVTKNIDNTLHFLGFFFRELDIKKEDTAKIGTLSDMYITVHQIREFLNQ